MFIKPGQGGKKAGKKLIVLCMGNWKQRKNIKHERRSNGISLKILSTRSQWLQIKIEIQLILDLWPS